jgi:hypothetical protein
MSAVEIAVDNLQAALVSRDWAAVNDCAEELAHQARKLWLDQRAQNFRACLVPPTHDEPAVELAGNPIGN